MSGDQDIITLRENDQGCDNVGGGGDQAHDDAPVEGHGHDAVHDEDDVEEVPGHFVRVTHLSCLQRNTE